MIEVLATLIVLGAASAAASVTVAWTKIFEWPRELVVAHCWAFLGHLVNCHYCIGHWVAAALVLAVNPWPGPVGMIVSWMAVTGFSGMFSTFVLKD